VTEEFRSALPFVITPVDIGDGSARELFIGNVLEATQVDSVHLSDRGFGSEPKGSNTAVLAKVVKVFSGVEPVLIQLRFARQQSEAIGTRNGRPKACSPADGAVAPVGALRQVDVRFELDGTTMATAVVCLEHQ
jgi:hypothetical protein